MLEDQAYILECILEIIGSEQPDAVLIAGDVYDKTVPSAEAVALLDGFLVKLADRSLPVLLISGNHDSPECLALANRLMEGRGSFTQLTSPDFYGQVERDAYVRVVLTDENDVYRTMGKLRLIYPNLMQLDYDNLRTRGGAVELKGADVKRAPLELFAKFYQQQNHQPMSEEQRRYLTGLLETIQEERA